MSGLKRLISSGVLHALDDFGKALPGVTGHIYSSRDAFVRLELKDSYETFGRWYSLEEAFRFRYRIYFYIGLDRFSSLPLPSL